MKPYHWFQGASVVEFAKQLQAAGPETARVEVRIEGDKMTLRIVPAAGDAGNWPIINDSHVCPPQC